MSGIFQIFASLRRMTRSLELAWGTVVVVVIASVLAGAANTGLLALINSALTGANGAPAKVAWGFAALCCLLPLLRFVSQVLLVRFNERIIRKLRLDLSHRILAAPLRQLEELGPHRLLAILTNDIGAITQVVTTLPLLLMHLTIVLCCLVFMGWLSQTVLMIILGFMVGGILSYQLPMSHGMRYFSFARESWDAIYGHLRALTEGIKELKLHGRRRGAFLHDMLDPSSRALEQHNVKATVVFTAAGAWGHVLFFIAIGLLVFVLPQVMGAAPEPRALTGSVLALLYMMGSLEFVLNTLPNMSRANVSVRRVEQLDFSLAEHAALVGAAAAPLSPPVAWRELELRAVTHEYRREDSDESFTLGPIDLTLRPAEILFIAGGNGSGKTTLAKLLAGLYAPKSGEIAVDGEAVGGESRRIAHRELFSAVFTDFFLFERLVGLETPDLDERALGYLQTLRLDHKVEISRGELSTVELSQGQRKRLALLTAFLEDRPIYLFDEWAADQDPSFKEIFYRQLLPELKSRDKSLVVITHDDRFFDAADRILYLEDGKAVRLSRAEAAPEGKRPAPPKAAETRGRDIA